MREEEKKSKSDSFVTLVIISFISGIALAPAPALALSSIISIDTYTLDVNSSVTVPIEISNASAVAGGSAKISFNPSVVSVQAILAEDFGTPVANINNTNGFVYVAASRATAVGKANASLASIRFKGVSKGITALNITNAYLNYENYTGFIPETSNGAIDVRTPSFTDTDSDSDNYTDTDSDNYTDTDSDSDTDSDTDSHSGDGYADSTAGAYADTAADDPVKEKVPSNEPTAINIDSYSVYENSNVIVPVEITHAGAVAGGSVNITFNPLFVNVEEVLPGDFGTPVANINNDAGFVHIACASPTAVGKDKARLASIRFKGVSKGLASLDIQDAALNDEDGNLITLETTSGGEIEVLYPFTPASHIVKENATTTIAVREHGVLLAIIMASLGLVVGVMVIAHLRKRRYKGER